MTDRIKTQATTATTTPIYTKLVILQKKAALVKYFETERGIKLLTPIAHFDAQTAAELKYEPRPVQMRVYLRCTRCPSHIYARIQCPINPYPVKGEFETPDETVLIENLHQLGWEVISVVDGCEITLK